jgi:hypothetical protein
MPRGGESGERDPMTIYSRIVKLSQGRGWEETRMNARDGGTTGGASTQQNPQINGENN